MPRSPDSVYQRRNLVFATQERGRLPTLYFQTRNGSGRLRQQHPNGPLIQPIRRHTSHAFFRHERDFNDFEDAIERRNGDVSRRTFRELRTQYGGSHRPRRGDYHFEANFSRHRESGRSINTHASGGRVIGVSHLTDRDVRRIYNRMRGP